MIQEVLTQLISGGGASKVDPPLGKLQNLNSFGTQIPYVSFTNKYKMIQDDLTLQFSGGEVFYSHPPFGLTLPRDERYYRLSITIAIIFYYHYRSLSF